MMIPRIWRNSFNIKAGQRSTLVAGPPKLGRDVGVGLGLALPSSVRAPIVRERQAVPHGRCRGRARPTPQNRRRATNEGTASRPPTRTALLRVAAFALGLASAGLPALARRASSSLMRRRSVSISLASKPRGSSIRGTSRRHGAVIKRAKIRRRRLAALFAPLSLRDLMALDWSALTLASRLCRQALAPSLAFD